MRRLSTMTASAAAAALTTLAVTVAVPAIADDAGDANDPGELAPCLRDNGLDGAPAGAGALKRWLGDRLERGDAATRRALETCMPRPVAEPGPKPEQLRACLTEHGLDIPGDDARALKRWLLRHGDDAANRDALQACDMGPVVKRVRGATACGEDVRAGSADGAREIRIFGSRDTKVRATGDAR